jgi:hypothetical protein
MIVKLNTLAEQIHALPEDERNYLLDLLLPEEAAPKRRKRKRGTATESHAAARKSSKSRSPIAEKIGGDVGSGLRKCEALLPNDKNKRCGLFADDVLHHDHGYGNYHEFVAAKAASGG